MASGASAARPFGFWTATALVVGGMIGAGIFVLPAQLAPFGTTGALAWGFAVAGAVIIAWVMSRLFAAVPDARGAVDACAAGLGTMPTVLVAWSYWVSTWAANAVLALTAVRYMTAFWPGLGSSTLAGALAALALLWGLALFNLAGLRGVGRFQVATTLLKLLPLVAVLATLAWLGVTSPRSFSGNPLPPLSAAQLTPALGLVFYALLGFESAGVAADRVRDPARNVPRATMAGVIVTGVIYVVISTGIVFALPQTELTNSGAPVALFVERFWGGAAGLITAGFAVISALGCLNGYVLLVGEVPLAMARSGQLPRWIARTNRRDVPAAAVLLATVLASALILSNASRTLGGLLTFMLTLTSAANLWFYAGVCAAALRLGVARGAAALGLAFSVWTLVGAGFEPVAWSVVLMLTALPLYWIAVRASNMRGAAPPA